MRLKSTLSLKNLDNGMFCNRNGKLFVKITEDNYETCGITTQLIDDDEVKGV